MQGPRRPTLWGPRQAGCRASPRGARTAPAAARRRLGSPGQFEPLCAIGLGHAFFSGFERKAGDIGERSALDAEIVDSFREIEDVVTLEPEAVERETLHELGY